ncbi:MAG TPA: bifunctional nuclease family protein [Bacillota bacterium]|jgi:bifunctional DNase/RNase|nr:bifunctional nuclease family protein [Candidatus Fermentithermobacillaceae bacterium]HOB30960.1 bifunctional nuclease family protein [Bacillota bacterium]HOK64755.1 bifunctional nuclease family protein [Bacillota bacterium]HOL12234.1 bifunctional nuclease family protein [Bacillota bacterium]HOQ03384.1 bifunctional nuclease family protein [Bacillota bacterium]
MIQVTVHRIGLDQSSDQAVILLGDLTRTTFIPIWVRTSEATAIAIPIQGIQSPRPITADLVVKVIEEFGADVVMAVITDLKDDIFYASLVLTKDDELIEIDCRPSDAIAVALRKAVPIYVEEKVMAEAGITGDDSEIQ